jgi:hypothetical protein
LRLVDLGQRRNDVVRPAQLAQGKLDAGPCRLLGLEENEFMGVGDDHEGVLAFLLREPDGEVLEDCAKMNLGDLQRRGDVLELLALLSGNAVIRKEHEIG